MAAHLATTGTAPTEMERPVNTIFKQTLLRNAKSRAVHYLGTSPASLSHNMGSTTASWRRVTIGTNNRSQLAEQTVAGYMGGTPAHNPSVMTISTPTATALKYGNFIILNEEADIINYNGQTDKIIEVLGIDAGDYLDILQRTAMVNNVPLVFVAGAVNVGAVVSKITKASIQAVVNTLDKNKTLTFTPMTTGSQNFGTSQLMPGFICINHPDIAIDVTQLAGFKPAETYAGQTSLFMGEYGSMTIAGQTVRFLSGHNADVQPDTGGAVGTTGLRSNLGTSVDTYNSMIYGKDAFGSLGFGATHPDGSFTAGDNLSSIEVIHKGFGTGGTSDVYNEISTIAYKFWHAALMLNPDWGRGIVSGATDLV